MRWLFVALLMVSGCGNAQQGKIEAARAGATIKLSGDQGLLTLRNKTWKPAITLDASNATFRGIALNGVTGLHIKGGTVIGPGGRSYGIHVLLSQNIDIDGMLITGAHRGIVMYRSQDVTVRDTQMKGLISDGVDITASQRVAILRNSCSQFTPKLATFDANGVKTDGDHPDCIQSWSDARYPPVADVTIIGNHIDGTMQGIFLRDVAGKTGGFDRVTIRNNVLRTGMSNAIAIDGIRGAVVRDNQVTAVPGATHIRNGARVKANIVVTPNNTGIICGNSVPDVPKNPANLPCG